MIVFAILAITSQTAAPSAAEFFPMKPGMVWEYETTGDGAGTYTQQIGAAVDAGGTMRAPMVIKIAGKEIQSTFYELTPTGVFVIGHEPKKLFAKPQPVFQTGEKGAKWDFIGPSPYEDDKEARLVIKGESKWAGQRNVLGQKRDCLVVKTENRIGLSESTATLFKNEAVYAKDVGLVEMDETVQFGKTQHKRHVRLVKFDPGQVPGE
ncbi:MAG TPA: hypothetical protein VJ835_11715 [Fimbriimonadaceae bacterium]|nr:hypothetical protein [Fimbriimonadaceae bacterium]